MKSDIKTFGELDLIGTIDISSVVEILNNNEELWQLDTSRQKTFRVHRKTENIVIIWTSNNPPYPMKENKKLLDLFAPFFSESLTILGRRFKFKKTKIVKFMFAKLLANSVIDPHIDMKTMIRHPERIHIPIITNEKVVSMINNKEFYMLPGHIYNFNNTLIHGIQNNSHQARIHCLIDYCDEDDLKAALAKE